MTISTRFFVRALSTYHQRQRPFPTVSKEPDPKIQLIIDAILKDKDYYSALLIAEEYGINPAAPNLSGRTLQQEISKAHDYQAAHFVREAWGIGS